MLNALTRVSLLTLLVTIGCTRSPMVLTPAGPLSDMDWTQEERSRPVALRLLRSTEQASHHVVLLSGSETPHVHDQTDLAVIVRRGQVRMHIGDRAVVMNPGDVVDIPRGVPHWAQNIAGEPSEAYLIASPPLDRSDTRAVE